MRDMLTLLVLLNLAMTGRGVWADDMNDVDADVEESIADSEAARSQARETKDRAKHERDETNNAKKQAARMRQDAEAKRKEAHAELQRIDKEVKALKNEQMAMTKESKKLDAQIAADDKKVGAAAAKLEKVKGETAAARQLRDEKAQKIADLQRKLTEINAGSGEAKQQLVQAKQEFERSQDEEKLTMQKLTTAKTEQAQKQALAEKQLALLKDKYRQSRERTTAMEDEIRGSRRKVQKMEEEAKVAESEVSQSDARMADAQDRLKEVRAKNREREAELSQRRTAAMKHMNSHDRERAEAMLRIDQARADQTNNRAIAARDSGSVSLQLTRKTASVTASAAGMMTLSRDCRVHERADSGSKSIGVKMAGQKVSGSGGSAWVSFATPEGRTGYIARSCF